jgi:hypothetical protein
MLTTYLYLKAYPFMLYNKLRIPNPFGPRWKFSPTTHRGLDNCALFALGPGIRVMHARHPVGSPNVGLGPNFKVNTTLQPSEFAFDVAVDAKVQCEFSLLIKYLRFDTHESIKGSVHSCLGR